MTRAGDPPWGEAYVAASSALETCNPVSRATLEAAVAALGDVRGRRVLDVGCGRGLTVELLAARGARVVGYDTQLDVLESARRRLLRSAVSSATLLQRSTPPPGRWDVVVLLGAAHCLTDGAVPDALRALRRVVTPGGRVLFGDGYWLRDPPAAVAAALSAEGGGMTDLPTLLGAVAANGWRVGFAHHSSVGDWDEFMRTYCDELCRRSYRRGAANSALAARLTWHHYQRDLRGTVGFVVLCLHAGPDPSTE